MNSLESVVLTVWKGSVISICIRIIFCCSWACISYLCWPWANCQNLSTMGKGHLMYRMRKGNGILDAVPRRYPVTELETLIAEQKVRNSMSVCMFVCPVCSWTWATLCTCILHAQRYFTRPGFTASCGHCCPGVRLLYSSERLEVRDSKAGTVHRTLTR